MAHCSGFPCTQTPSLNWRYFWGREEGGAVQWQSYFVGSAGEHTLRGWRARRQTLRPWEGVQKRGKKSARLQLRLNLPSLPLPLRLLLRGHRYPPLDAYPVEGGVEEAENWAPRESPRLRGCTPRGGARGWQPVGSVSLSTKTSGGENKLSIQGIFYAHTSLVGLELSMCPWSPSLRTG